MKAPGAVVHRIEHIGEAVDGQNGFSLRASSEPTRPGSSGPAYVYIEGYDVIWEYVDETTLKRVYLEIDCNSSPMDSTPEIDGAEAAFLVTIKFDGCSIGPITFPESHHFCGSEEWARYAAAIARAWEIARQIMGDV